MTEADATIEPIGGKERVAALDIIRGIAILFILFLNIPYMGSYGSLSAMRVISWTQADKSAWMIMQILDGTQRGLLELLFGAGIMIMARNAMRPDGPVAIADLHYRRNWLLIGFGLVNALVLFWTGDILVPYGIVALLIFPIRLFRPRTQIALAALGLTVSAAQYVRPYLDDAQHYRTGQVLAAKAAAHQLLTAQERGQLTKYQTELRGLKFPEQSPQVRKAMAERAASHTAPFLGYAEKRWKFFIDAFDINYFTDELPEIAGTMALGMALFQLGFIQGQSHPSTYMLTMIGGYGIGISIRAHEMVQTLGFTRLQSWEVSYLIEQLSRIPITVGHLSAIHLALHSHAGRRLLAPFQANGRMPLTTYLSASFITMWVLFPSFGFGLFGRYSYAGVFSIALVIIITQLIAANIWMRFYETGPLEWIWKSLAYQRRMPFRRAPATTAVSPAPIPA